METANANSESKSKYEKEIREMSTKIKEMTEQVFELENQLKDEEQNNTIQRQEWHKREQMMERELQQLREAKDELTGSNKTLQ